MGLTVWSGDQIIQTDVTIAKNYLGDIELKDLNRLVDMVLNFFEDQVDRGWIATMGQAMSGLAEILKVNKRKLLPDYGSIKKTTADNHAKAEYKKFKVLRADADMRALADVKADVKALPKPPRRSKKAS